MIRKIVGIMTGLLVLAGCSSDELLNDQQSVERNGGVKTFTSFTATLDDVAGTRAYLEGVGSNGVRHAFWEEGDVISVYSDTDIALKQYVLESISENGEATFTGEQVTGRRFYAVYAPRRECSVDEANPNIVHFRHSGSMTSVMQDNDTFFLGPMVATSTDRAFAFMQTTGIIQITVGNIHQLGDVTLEGNDNEIIEGSGYIDFSQNQPTLILDGNAGFSDMTQGFGFAEFDGEYADIYYSIPPAVFENGFRISIEGIDNKGNIFAVEKRYESNFEVKAASLSKFSLVDVTAELEANAANIIVFADPIVKQICVANWDTNGDGELSYAEAAAVTDIGNKFEQKNKINSLLSGEIWP